MEKIIRSGIGIVGICACSLVVSSCSSGSLGSDVGEDKNAAPMAVAQVLNAGDTMTFRTGAEVLLTGKDSEDPDGPIIGYSWSGPAGVVLRERNSSTVAFTVPNVADGSQLTFTLTVTDADNETGQATASITVKNALDPDRYLSMKLVSESADPTVFFVKPVLAQQIGAAAGDATYSITVESFVIYPRMGSGADCTALAGTDPTDAEVSAGVMAGGDCLITRQAELAVGAGQIDGAWPEGVDPAANPGVSPAFQLDIPRTDAGSLTPYPIPENARDRILELFAIPRSYHMVRAEAAPLNPAYLDEIVIGVRNRAANGALVETEVSAGATVAWANVDVLRQNLTDAESVASAEQYYSAVDPGERRRTFNDWLCNAGFGRAADCAGGQAIGAVRLRPEAIAGDDVGSEMFAHATYLNNFDLGFGRDMYSRVDGETGYVYSFVNNYASLEGALRKATPIVAVVMEFSPPEDENGMPTSDVPFVKFFTYAPDGSGDMQLATSMNFDGRGELVTPGNCVACHGGTDPGTLDFSAGEVDTNATFLPWDVDSLLFMDTDPAIRDAMPSLDGTTLLDELRALEPEEGDFSSANQLVQIRKLNTAALATYTHENIDPERSQPAIDLLEHWYGPATTIQVGSQQRDMQVLDGDFSDSPPDSWQTGFMVLDPADAGRIYTDVFAQNCRMCHTNAEDTSLQFDSYDAMLDALGCYTKDANSNITGFVSNSCADNVFNESKMPAARLTADRFWVDFGGGESASEILRAHLITTASNAGQSEFNIAEAPAARAIIGAVATPVNRGDTVQLDGSQSLFADSYSWTLTAPSGPPASNATLVGASTAIPSFAVDVPGDYIVDLVVNQGTGALADSLVIAVANRPPIALDDSYSLNMLESETPTLTVDAPNGVVASNDEDADGDQLVASLVQGRGPSFGSLTFNPDGSFEYVYEDNRFTPPRSTDTFTYEVQDGFEGADQAEVSIALAAAPDTKPPTAPTNLSEDAANRTSFNVTLNWSASTDNETGIFRYVIYRQRLDSEGVADGDEQSITVSGEQTTFTDQGLADNTSYRYAVAARDFGAPFNESSRSGSVTVTTEISYRQSIHSIWSLPLANEDFCTRCHTGGSDASGDPALDLSRTASQLLTQGNALGLFATNSQRVVTTSGAESTSRILCIPLEVEGTIPSSCKENASHIPHWSTNDPRYQAILLWIQQGAQDN